MHGLSGRRTELFELQRHKELQPSFDFIAECLLPESGHFHSIPGKGHEVVIDVITSPPPTAKPASWSRFITGVATFCGLKTRTTAMAQTASPCESA